MKNQEIKEALNILIEKGMFERVRDIKLYHGRVGESDKIGQWKVEPEFNNASNATGNHNVNKIKALSTSTDRQVAESYAKKRLKEKLYYDGDGDF